MSRPPGAALRDLRGAAGLSAREVAQGCHVSRSLVYQWESGERRPRSRDLARLAAVLGVRLTELLPAAGDQPGDEPVPVPGLRAARLAAGTPQRQLAEVAGCHPSTVSAWERGVRHPRRSVAERMAEELGVPIAALRAGPAPPPRARDRGLRAARERTGLTRGEVARRSGLSVRTLRRLEEGGRPSLGQLRLLARVYRTPPARLAAWCGLESPRLLTRPGWSVHELPLLLRELRSWTDLTARELERRLPAGTGVVSSWERGEHLPSPAHRRRLEAVFGLPSGSLGGDGGPLPEKAYPVYNRSQVGKGAPPAQPRTAARGFSRGSAMELVPGPSHPDDRDRAVPAALPGSW